MTQASNAYFERVAGQWDSIRASYFGEAVRQAAIARAYLRPEMTVADVGAGTGFIAAGLAPLVRKVYVLDGSPAMLEVARKNLVSFSNVEFLPGEALALPLPWKPERRMSVFKASHSARSRRPRASRAASCRWAPTPT